MTLPEGNGGRGASNFRFGKTVLLYSRFRYTLPSSEHDLAGTRTYLLPKKRSSISMYTAVH